VAKEHLAIIIISDNPLLPVSPAHDMVSSSWKLDPYLARHNLI
jgi:hypothetical protein